MANDQPSRSFDPFALARAACSASSELLNVQLKAARQWSDFWSGAWSGAPGEKPRDRRFSASEWQDQPYFRAIRDAYLLASRQLRESLSNRAGHAQDAMARFLLDQFLNAISPSNFAATNPEVVKRTMETSGANLVDGFFNLLEDVASGKGIVQRRTD